MGFNKPKKSHFSHPLTPSFMRKHIIALLTIAVLLMSTGCLGTGAGVITIGGIAPLTGDGASYGIELQRVAEMALADVNEAWADKGMELDIQWEDGGCNGKDASTAAQKLVDIDQVEIIHGGFCSSETLSAAAITDPAGVILFSSGSSSPDVTDAGDYVYRDWPSDNFQAVKLAELANELGYTKIAVITEQQDYTLGISTAFKAAFEALGGTVVEETYLASDMDFKTQLTKLSAEEPDTYLVNPQTPVKSDIIMKQMQELGLEGPFLLNDVAGTSSDLLSTYADYLEGSFTATVDLDLSQEGLIDLQADYLASFGEEITYLTYEASTYDAVWILANAIMEVGNNAEAVKAYLDDFPGYDGLMGSIDFDENGDPLTGHVVFTVSNGEIVVY